MSGFKSQFSQFPRFIQQGGVVTPNQMPQQMPPQMPEQIPPSPPPQMPVAPFVPPERKSPMKVVLLTILALVILSGAGLGIVLGLRIWDPTWNPFRPKPEVVFSQAILKMKDINKYGFKASGKITLNAADANSTSANLQASASVSGTMDVSDILNPKLSSILDFVLDLSFLNEKTGVSSKGEIRVADKDLYFKINKLEASGLALDELGHYVASLNDIKDKWIIMTKDQLMAGASQNAPTLPEDKQKELELKIKEIMDKYPIWQVKEQLADKRVNTEDVYHYVIALNNENLKKAFSEIVKASAELQSNYSVDMPVDYFLGMMEGFADTFSEKIGEVKADIWIGKKDLLVYKIDFKKTVDLKQVVGIITGNLSIDLNLELSDHNKPVNVEIPSDAKSYDEVFGPFIQKSQNKAKNARIEANMNQIRTTAEMIFSDKKTYSGISCKTKDIDILCADIKTLGGEEPKVFGYYNKYCTYAKLQKISESDKQEYYCIDSNLSIIQTDIDPSLKGYCTGWTFVCPKSVAVSSPTPIPSPTPTPPPVSIEPPLPTETPTP